MKPVKLLAPVSNWLLRISLIYLLYVLYFDTCIKFSFNSLYYFIAFVMILFAVLFVIGSFMKNSGLTVISSLIIFILSVIVLFVGHLTWLKIFTNFTPIAISCYFLSQDR
jgi:hypothetical protein